MSYWFLPIGYIPLRQPGSIESQAKKYPGAIAPFTEITLRVVKALAKRTENVPVHKFYLGLDFEDAPMGIRLAEGNYIAAQVPSQGERTLKWHKSLAHHAVDVPLLAPSALQLYGGSR